MTQLTKNFSREELACRHCGKMEIPLASIERLQRVRDRVGHYLKISSGYRCPEHNNAVSKTGRTGPHTKAAFDVLCYGDEAYHVIQAAQTEGFTGIGVNQKGLQEQRFIHLDDLTDAEGTPRPHVWGY